MIQIKISAIAILLVLISNCCYSQSCLGSYNKMNALYKEGKINEAITIGEKAKPLCEKEYGKNSENYSTFIHSLASYYFLQGDYKKSEPLLVEALAILKKVSGTENPNYSTLLNNLASLYSNQGDFSKAEPLYLEALVIRKKVLGSGDSNIATSLNDLASLYCKQGTFAKAEPLYLEALAIRKKEFGIGHPYYASSLNNLASLYQHQGDYKKAEPLFWEALTIQKKVLGIEHPDYATSLNNLASLNFEQGKYEKVELFFMEALAIRKKALGANHPDYASSLNNLATLYQHQGKYNKAEPLFSEALLIQKKVLGIYHRDYATTIDNLANLYNNQGDYGQAESFYTTALTIRKKILGVDHPDYAASVNNLAIFYWKQGNYVKAEPLFLEALAIQKKVLGLNHPDYATLLNNLAIFYGSQNKKEKEEPLFLEALAIRKKVLGTSHPDYASSLNTLADFYNRNGNYGKAEPLFLEAIGIQKRVLGAVHPSNSTLLDNLAKMYMNQGEYSKALPIYLEALAILKKTYGVEHPEYASTLANLSVLYKVQGNLEYTTYLKELLPLNQQQIIKHCSFQTTIELTRYLNNRKYDFMDGQFSLVYPFTPVNGSINGDLFNTTILLNNLTLRNTDQVKNKIRKRKDTALLNSLEHFQFVKNQIIKYAGIPKSEQPSINADLENEAEQLEKKLLLGSQEFKEANEFTKTTWLRIQQSLKKNEAAVEFVSFSYLNYLKRKWEDGIFYTAMVIRPNYAYPKIITLFEQQQLDSLLKRDSGTMDSGYINHLYSNDNFALYKLIVKPLDSLLQGVTTIYAAPSGLLHTINLPLILANKPDGSRFNVHLVGTTGELPQYTSLQLNKNTIKNAYIFGGIDYEKVNNTSISFKSATYTPGFEQMASVASRGEISTWGYLPGTLTEATQIEKLNNNAGVKATVLSGIDASETNFKNLNAISSPFILHLATHGYFFRDAVKEKPSDFNSLNTDKKTMYKWADDPLLRSGLILAGGNKAWKNNTHSSDSTEDGILTSMEVANVDLSNCKLAVLSACETGLGDINGSEGVFGLQRGFKLAGVKNIIMSLWKIPDTQSAELLTLFYENCFSGLSVHESLKQAQLSMSKKYPPYYWAGFTLLE